MSTDITRFRHPIIAAPMAGGPSTVEFCAAVSKAGAFPFLAAGYVSASTLSEHIAQLRASTDSFGVNVFVPDSSPVDLEAYQTYTRELADDMAAYNLTAVDEPIEDDDEWQNKLDLLTTDPVPVVSFTFGLPPVDVVDALHAQDTSVWITVTTADEAKAAEMVGADALVVQAPAAGGHSATFTPELDPADIDLGELVAAVRDAVDLPLIAAGGIDSADAVRAALAAGASAVSIGTALLLADEAGTSQAHREALQDPSFTETVVTRAFTGRPARALANDFTARHTDSAPTGYPAIHHLTRPLRQAASAAGDLQHAHLWAGTGWRQAQSGPVADIIADLIPDE